MGSLRNKIQIKKEFILACKIKKLEWKFVDAIHLISGKGKVWKIKFNCSEGHDALQGVSNFRKKPVCLKCMGLSFSKEEHLERLNKTHNNYYRYDDFEYKGSKKLITYFCPAHKGNYDQSYESHLSGKGCGICKLNKPKTGKQIIKLVKHHSNGFVSVVGMDEKKTYKSSEKFSIKCNVHSWHKVQEKPIRKITRGIKCGFCNASKYELIAYFTLHQLGVSFEIEQQIKYKNTIHYIDIVLKEKNKNLIFIEIDGEQHSSDKHWGNKKGYGKIELLKIKKRDKQKNKYAESKKINLIRISYKENIKEKITSIINKGNFKKVSKINKNFSPSMIKTSEKIASEIHKMYNDGKSYKKITSNFNVIPSYISNIVTGEKFKELFFYLYPDGDNPNLRRKQVKHIKLTKVEDKFLKKEVKKKRLFADIRKDFSIKFRPMSRGQFDRYADNNGFKTPYFITFTKAHISIMKKLRLKGCSYKYIASTLNNEGLDITRPTVRAKLKPFNL